MGNIENQNCLDWLTSHRKELAMRLVIGDKCSLSGKVVVIADMKKSIHGAVTDICFLSGDGGDGNLTQPKWFETRKLNFRQNADTFGTLQIDIKEEIPSDELESEFEDPERWDGMA